MEKPSVVAGENFTAVCKTLGGKLKALRGERHRTVVAREAGLSLFTVQRIEYGTANPSVATLLRLADYYGVAFEDLFR